MKRGSIVIQDLESKSVSPVGMLIYDALVLDWKNVGKKRKFVLFTLLSHCCFNWNFFFFSLKYIGSITKNEVCRGYGGFGALGHSVYHRELFPRLVEGSWNGKMQHIATSGAHTAAITESGFFFLTYPFFIYIYMDIPFYVYSVWFGF